MKLIIAGSRSFADGPLAASMPHLVRHAIDLSGWQHEITEIVSGGARGIDQSGEDWARDRHINVRVFPPDYRVSPTIAPLRRNWEMAKYGDALLVIYDGESAGTAHMIRCVQSEGKPIKMLTVPMIFTIHDGRRT